MPICTSPSSGSFRQGRYLRATYNPFTNSTVFFISSSSGCPFASGIYFSKFHQSILGFAEKNLPDDKKVFLICTYGGSANYKSIEQTLDKKRSKVIGKFGCKGYDTFGPFKLVGGIAKGHPDEEDIKNAVEFVKVL